MEDSKENHRGKYEGDGGSEYEDDGEEEVVGRVLHEEECEELSVKLYLRQPLVEAQGRGGAVSHKSLEEGKDEKDYNGMGLSLYSSCCRGSP